MAVDDYHTRDMNRKYDLNSKEEVSELNSLLNTYGIHLEMDLFEHVYMIIDHNLLRQSHSQSGRPQAITPEVIEKARSLKQAGKSVRQIAKELSISIGSVSKITRSTSI